MGKSKGGLLGGATQTLFGDGGAAAAQGAAMEAQRLARNWYKTNQKDIDRVTTEGLMSFDKDIANQEKNLSRQEQLIGQIDPTIIEASQQALRLLKGEESSTLNPLKAQRNQQRQKLINSLREQLGPGAETSTAGIQALTRFDSESGNLFAGAQQQALSNMGGIAGQFNAVRPDMFREIMGLSSLGQGKTNLGFNRINEQQKAYAPFMATAGARFTKDMMIGQQNAAFGQQVFNTALSSGIGAMSGPAGAAASSGGGASSFTMPSNILGATG